MDKVTDIFAFAANNPDYFAEFLSGTTLPDELSSDEKTALEAAKEHVEEALYEVLNASGTAVAAACDAEPTKYYAATRKNRYVKVKVPKGTKDSLYGLRVALQQASGQIKLVVSLDTKMEAQDAIAKKLSELNILYTKDGYRLSAPGIDIKEGDDFATLAGKAAEVAQVLMKGVIK